MLHSEIAVMTSFNLGAVTGLLCITYSVLQASTPSEMTSHVTKAFLMSILGNCLRILANHRAKYAEKIVISAAVLTYTFALYCDYTNAPITAVRSKLITTGCVGFWNALQMVRLNNGIAFISQLQSASLAWLCYSLGAALGYGAFGFGLLLHAPIENLAPFITFAFLMSHWGNLVRTEVCVTAEFFEKNYIRLAVLSYCLALICDFTGGTVIVQQIAAYTKLIAATNVGLWNSMQTHRFNPDLFTYLRVSPLQIPNLFPSIVPISASESRASLFYYTVSRINYHSKPPIVIVPTYDDDDENVMEFSAPPNRSIA